jgi:hypothetical protein
MHSQSKQGSLLPIHFQHVVFAATLSRCKLEKTEEKKKLREARRTSPYQNTAAIRRGKEI